jgi:arylsulfatase A-like enzyme
MKRRELIKSTAAVSAGTLAGLGQATRPDAADAAKRQSPNILFVLVDELRFPTVFPAGVKDADQFFAKFMPNLHKRLWTQGVKFGKHFTAASACTPARGVLISGLYSQQSWLAVTILATPDARVSLSPVLNRAYPTYGKLLKAAGYQTPYVGKWHASVPPQNPQRYLKAYGFDGMTLPDPTGSNLQGTVGNEQEGYHNDQDIADQAVSWLSKRSAGDQPWCLTVSFVNPHDKEFFWGGTEFKTFNDLYDRAGQKLKPFTFYSFNDGKKYPPFVPWAKDPLKSPRSYGYPALPPNWESLDKLKRTKPSTQAGVRQFSELVWGGVSDDPKADAFTIAPYPVLPDTYGIAYAPYHYWRRNLDSYTQIIQIVDERIGEVLSALPKAVADDTIIVFTSDHGEYAGAHGFVSGKVGSLYDEAYHVPLIVVDPTGRFTGDIDTPRDGLTSSVDMLAMLVSLGFGGSRKWMVGPLADLYGRRHDMLPMLRSAKAAGRDHVLLATDEQAPGFLVGGVPFHLLGLRTQDYKLGVYSDWKDGTTTIDTGSIETEFYDYGTSQGRAEVANTPHDPRAAPALKLLLDEIMPKEFRAPLPAGLRGPQTFSRARYLAYSAFLQHINSEDTPTLHKETPWGRDF